MPASVLAPIVLDGLGLQRRGQCLLRDCSLVVEPGEILAIMGRSGAGKTTLLRTVAGLDAPTAGSVHRTPGPVATVFQDPRLLPWRTARANVALVLDAADSDRAVDWLERVGLGDALDVYPGALSGGMRQRVAIARALASGAATVLVDEPFASLDVGTAERLRTLLLAELCALGRPVLWVTHDADEAAAVADRVLTLTGPPEGTWELRTLHRAPSPTASASGSAPAPSDAPAQGAPIPAEPTAPVPELIGKATP